MSEHQFRPGDIVKYRKGSSPYYITNRAPKIMRTFRIKKLLHVPTNSNDCYEGCYNPEVHQSHREMVGASQWAILKKPRHSKQKGLIQGSYTSTYHLELVSRPKRK